MHLPQLSSGGEGANLLHSFTVTKSELPHVRSTVPIFLLQPVWSPEHLRVLKVKVRTDAPITTVLNRFHLPKTGNDDFEELVSEITAPSRGALLDIVGTKNKLHLNTFSSLFSSLHTMSDLSSGCTSQNSYIRTSKAAITALVEAVLPYVDDEGSLRVDPTSVPFHLKRLAVKGVLPCDGCIIKTDMQGLMSPLPVATFSVARPQDHQDVEAQQVAQLVLQAALAFEQNPDVNTYKTFVIHVNGTRLQIISADIPRMYLDRLFQGKPCQDGFEVLHSETFDMLEVEGRREALRIAFGLLKSLRAKPVRRRSN